MQVREIVNPFTGVYNTFTLDAKRVTLTALKRRFGKEKLFYRDGVLLEGRVRFSDDDLVVTTQAPGEAGTAALVVMGVMAVVAVGISAYTVYYMRHMGTPDFSKIQTNPSLRGSRNTARQNNHIPILLGHHRIYPDIASLTYTEYSSDDQYLHELFCFGYNSVQLDTGTLRIGETPFGQYLEASYSVGTDKAAVRVVESAINIKLAGGTPVTRTTASHTTSVSVGMAAPSGFYHFQKDGDKENEQASFTIEWKPKSGDTWTTAHTVNLDMNRNKWRKSYRFTPTGDPEGRYDVRVTRTTPLKDSARDVDYLYYDVLRCYVYEDATKKDPVWKPDRFRLLSVRIKATDQLNGIIDEINCEGTLKTYTYKGEGTGPDAWEQKETTNPASAILYLLLDPYANPRPISKDKIVWSEFEAFYAFCKEKGYECNAWVSTDHTIADIIGYIATTNQASVRSSGGKIGIVIDTAHPSPTQLFTPRNAWDFREEDNLDGTTDTLKVKFVDASCGYVEVERYVSVDDDGTVTLDKADTSQDNITEMVLFGVTSATQAARIGKVRLLEMRNRYRTFTWSCDLEGLLCMPGDMVLLEHDTFLLGSGEGRVTHVIRDEEGRVTSIHLDSRIDLPAGNSYGITIRNAQAITRAVPVEAAGKRTSVMRIAQPAVFPVEDGDLVAVGVAGKEAREVLVSSIERNDDMSCKITAVDYAQECYEDGPIKAFDPGITRPPTGGPVGTGVSTAAAIGMPGAPGPAGAPAPRYLGMLEAAPAAPADGSYFLYSGETGTTYTKGRIYQYRAIEGSWEDVSSSSYCVGTALLDSLNLSGNEGSVMPAATAFISYLGLQYLEFASNGGFKSSNYTEENVDLDDTHSILAPSAGFKADASSGTMRMYGAVLRNAQIVDGTFKFRGNSFGPRDDSYPSGWVKITSIPNVQELVPNLGNDKRYTAYAIYIALDAYGQPRYDEYIPVASSKYPEARFLTVSTSETGSTDVYTVKVYDIDLSLLLTLTSTTSANTGTIVSGTDTNLETIRIYFPGSYFSLGDLPIGMKLKGGEHRNSVFLTVDKNSGLNLDYGPTATLHVRLNDLGWP